MERSTVIQRDNIASRVWTGFILGCLVVAIALGLFAQRASGELLVNKPKAASIRLAAIAVDDWLPTRDARPVGDYWLSYDGRTKSARYVVEYLTARSLAKRVDRAAGFRADLDALSEARASTADYEASGYDQGHLAPADFHKADDDKQSATFVLSNAAPQVPECNRGCWRLLEAHVRTLAEESEAAIVITAPLYLPDKDGNVVLKTIGVNRVFVPTHFAKAVIRQSAGSDLPEVMAWIVPNSKAVGNDLTKYLVSIDDFEAGAGIDVFAPLPDDIEKSLESLGPPQPVKPRQ